MKIKILKEVEVTPSTKLFFKRDNNIWKLTNTQCGFVWVPLHISDGKVEAFHTNFEDAVNHPKNGELFIGDVYVYGNRVEIKFT